MNSKKRFIFIILALILISGQTAEASSVKIWDTIVKDTGHKFYAFDSSYAWANKENWVQVPYGTLNYHFIGNQVIENGNFWFFIHDSGFDSPFMYANMSGSPAPVGEMYIKTTIDGINKWNFYKKSVIITKNTPEESIVIVDSGYTPGINVIQYRIKEDSHYIEAKPTTDHDFLAGFHSSPNRFAVAPVKNGTGTDFVVDPKNYSNIPEGKHIWFYPDEQYENMMVQEINIGGWFLDYMIIYDDWTSAKPLIEVYKENNIMRLGSMRAHMRPGTSNERIYFAQINTENIFYEETPNQAMSAGDSYTSVSHPTIPGRWRISGRVRAADGSEKYYTHDIYDQNFVFVSPISGTLEAIALYLYDRTGGTPSDITTPMDVYRDIMGQRTTLTTPTFSIPSGTYPDSQSISILTSTTDATIRYTIDGTTPTETSSIYSTPIVISSTTTLKAIAWKSGLPPSGIATATYTITTPVQAPAPIPAPSPVLSSIKNP
ncbi:MAG: chitobiase/beta-hexosaminidase C-terminal domain-containing protein, partial [ANME-2 cluster archaeon]|nr:chitobiase/beta-hexosaminidase C-terminal domain-containing protein [ANME-2 cluster archaeon]